MSDHPAPTAVLAKVPFMVRTLVPMVVLSLACLVASAVIFAIDGRISSVWVAFLLTVAGPLLFPFLLFPAGLMAGLWQALHGRQTMLVRFFAVGSVAYIAAMLALTLMVMAGFAQGLPASGSMRVFTEMFVISGALSPWAVFALRERDNQLFIMMLWSLVIAALVLLPVRLTAEIRPLLYGASAWAIMLAVMLVEYLRQTAVVSKKTKPVAAPAAVAADAETADEEDNA